MSLLALIMWESYEIQAQSTLTINFFYQDKWTVWPFYYKQRGCKQPWTNL